MGLVGVVVVEEQLLVRSNIALRVQAYVPLAPRKDVPHFHVRLRTNNTRGRQWQLRSEGIAAGVTHLQAVP